MSFAELPATAAWRHQDARAGFEVVQFERLELGHRIYGCTAAVEAGEAWVVAFEVDLDPSWTTKQATVTARSARGQRRLRLDADGAGQWWIDGRRAPQLDGCLDIDLESSALTNTLPVHRLNLGVGRRASVPAAYVRADGLAVERLEQDYTRLDDGVSGQAYRYAAPIFDFTCCLTYDGSGLVLDYPGIASRAL